MEEPSLLEASYEAEKTAILAQTEETARLFTSELIHLQELHKSQRQVLLDSLSQLDQDFAERKATLKRERKENEVKVIKKLKKIHERYRNDRNRQSLYKLPAEILGYIFERCIEADPRTSKVGHLGTSPWILARVCRAWYRIALGTPTLWCKILVTDCTKCYWDMQTAGFIPSHERTGSVRSHSSIQICVNTIEIRKALQRSGAAPLEITLAFLWRSEDSISEPGAHFYHRLYREIFNDSVNPRISRLILDNQEVWDIFSSVALSSITGIDGSLPNLTSLQINSLVPFSMTTQDGTPMLKAALESARKLREIRLGLNAVPEWLQYSTWRLTGYSSSISSLKELRVRKTHTLDSILGGPVNIESLVIDGTAAIEEVPEERYAHAGTVPWPTMSTPEITFHRLIRLHLVLDDFSLLAALRFPVLEALRLTQSGRWGPQGLNENGVAPHDSNFSLDLPNLRSLRVTSPYITPLNRLNMPQLDSIHLTSTRIQQSKCDVDILGFLSGKAIETGTPEGSTESEFLHGVTALHIDAMISEKGLVSAIKKFPSLRSLHVVPGNKIGKSLGMALTVGRHTRKTLGVLCPDLAVLEIDCYSFQQLDRKERKDKRVGSLMADGTEDVLEKLVTSRRLWGTRLERCTVVRPNGERREYI